MFGVDGRFEVGLPSARESPDPNGAIPRARDDERVRREELAVRLSDGVNDLQAADGARMTVEDVRLNPLFNRPDADGPVGAPADEDIALVLERPDASFVAVETGALGALLDAVDIDRVLEAKME